MKKISKILLILVMLMAAAFTAIACNNRSIDSINVENADLPIKTVYIYGVDTEFQPFGGSLTVHYTNGDTESVSLEDSRVTCSGFDPEKIGNQTITVTFNGKTCEFPVRMVQRIAASSGVVTNYFIGEKFDRSGSLVLTRDDLSTQTISFEDPGVNVSGIEDFSATEGRKEIKISYESYSDTLVVNVYQAGTVTATYGNTRYDSHEHQLNLSQAVLHVATADGNIKKDVPLTEEILSDSGVNDVQIFDEAREELLQRIVSKDLQGNDLSEEFTTRTINYKYAGKDLHFDISVYLSRQSYIMYFADKYAGIDYRGVEEENEDGEMEQVIKLTEDQNNYDKVTSVAQMYFDLSDDQKAGVEEAKRDDLVKLAAYHWYHRWVEIVTTGKLGETFNLTYDPYSYDAYLTLNAGSSYDLAVETLAYLREEDTLKDLNAVNNALWQVLGNDELSNLVVYQYDVDRDGDGELDVETLSSFLFLAIPQSDVDLLITQLDKAIKLYDILDGVTLDEISEVPGNPNVPQETKDKIKAAYAEIIDTTSPFFSNRNHYALIKLWNEDFFDIMYQYYWNITRDHNLDGTQASTDAWTALVYLAAYSILPSDDLENFYSTAVTLLQYMQTDLYDATPIYYYYNLMMDYYGKLEDLPEGLYKNLYEEIGYNFPIIYDSFGLVPIDLALDQIETYLIQYRGASKEIPEVQEYINFYVDMYAHSMENGYYEKYNEETDKIEFTENFTKDMDKLIGDYFKLSPADQTIFMNAVSYLYGQGVRFFDLKSYSSADGAITSFTGFIASYYNNILGEDALQACDDLFFAYEYYLHRNDDGEAKNNFFTYYYLGQDEYEALESDEQNKIKVVYDALTKVYDLYDDNEEVKEIPLSTIGDDEWEERMANLAKAVDNFYFAFLNYSGTNTLIQMPLICSFINAKKVYDEFVEELNKVQDAELKARILNCYNYGEYVVLSVPKGDGTGGVEEAKNNVETIFKTTWNDYCFYELNTQFDFSGTNVSVRALLDDDINPGVRAMFAEVADIIVQAQNLLYDDNWDIKFTDKDGEAFRKFLAAPSNGGYTYDQKSVMYMIDSAAGQTTMPLFTISMLLYYNSQFADVAGATEAEIQAFTSAISNYIILVESYVDYRMLYEYDPEVLAQFDAQNQLAFQAALNEMAQGYDDAKSTFNTSYNALTGKAKEEFDKIATNADIEYFKTSPDKAPDKSTAD